MRSLFLLLSVLYFFGMFAQQPESRNGWTLPPHDTIRLLIVLTEVEYDKGSDPFPASGYEHWRAGELPDWKDQIADPLPADSSKGILTRYFREASFNNYIVLGDRLIDPDNPHQPIRIKASEGVSPFTVIKKINGFRHFATAGGLTQQHFDLWTMTSEGQPKINPSKDSLPKYDHVMFIFRNSKLGDYSGYSSPGTPGMLWGLQSDSYSQFNASNGLPFRIMLHEYSHQLYGGNNFHVGGGQHGAGGANYFIPFQGGWSNMGAANSSLLTCNAWDRDRMDWKGPGKQYNISCMDSSKSHEVTGDIDAANPVHAGIYLLRDFVSSGDALRIKLPFIPANEYPQWIWIENHQPSHNKSDFDKFHHHHSSCVDRAPGGLYMYLQADKFQKQGNNIYGGQGDYLRPMPAAGMFDLIFDSVKVKNTCVNDALYLPFTRKKDLQNSLSGNHSLEMPVHDLNNNCSIEKNEYYNLFIEKTEDDSLHFNLPFLGSHDNAFTLNGNNQLSLGSNPSSASMMTLVSDQPSARLRSGPPNNRKVYINGLSVKIMEQRENGDILVEIKFNETNLNHLTRWCADSIVISRIEGAGHSVNINKGATLLIDRGSTATRITEPEMVNGRQLFNSATVLVCRPGSSINLKEGSSLILDNNSTILLEKGSRIIVNKGSKLLIKKGSKIVQKEKHSLVVNKGGKLIKEK